MRAHRVNGFLVSAAPWLSALVLAGLGTIACGSTGIERPNIDTPDIRIAPELPDPPSGPGYTPFIPSIAVACPNVSATIVGDSAPATHHDTLYIALADEISHIPEYHDCQRLVDRTTRRYGTLAGVWARESLETIGDEAYAAATGVPTVEVYNFTRLPYAPLGIEPGYNCLYVRRGSQWEARMIPKGTHNACPDGISRGEWDNGRALSVNRVVNPRDSRSIPPVARWDWDERRKAHYIGVRCGAAWCEVGVGPLTSSTWYNGTVTERIKGWYDEQWLAIPDGATGRLVPGPRAKLVPVPNLEQMNEADFACPDECTSRQGSWVNVATATLTSSGHQVYESKLNLHPGRTSYIALRLRTTATGPHWQSRIISGTDTAYKRVRWVDHRGMHVPGTARWFWHENDEMAWVRCAVGCCSITGDEW